MSTQIVVKPDIFPVGECYCIMHLFCQYNARFDGLDHRTRFVLTLLLLLLLLSLVFPRMRSLVGSLLSTVKLWDRQDRGNWSLAQARSAESSYYTIIDLPTCNTVTIQLQYKHRIHRSCTPTSVWRMMLPQYSDQYIS